MARIAGAAHGVATREELLAVGLTPAEIKHRLRVGALIAEYRGVYRVGHKAPSLEARYMAAVKACGDGDVLSGRAAGFHYGILDGAPPPPEVTTHRQREIDGLLTRCCRRLTWRDVCEHRGIPITTVPRTLVDLAAVLAEDDLARACHKGGVMYRIKPRDVKRVLQRYPNAPGARKLRRIMEGEVKVTLSKLERLFLKLLREAGLPLPLTNKRVGEHRVDCHWPEYGLTVELISWRYHPTRWAWEQDRRRERAARARDERWRSYTYGDVAEDAAGVVAELRPLLAVAA
jgi:hypothetical protein